MVEVGEWLLSLINADCEQLTPWSKPKTHPLRPPAPDFILCCWRTRAVITTTTSRLCHLTVSPCWFSLGQLLKWLMQLVFLGREILTMFDDRKAQSLVFRTGVVTGLRVNHSASDVVITDIVICFLPFSIKMCNILCAKMFIYLFFFSIFNPLTWAGMTCRRQ